jgi:hypothetical protein
LRAAVTAVVIAALKWCSTPSRYVITVPSVRVNDSARAEACS